MGENTTSILDIASVDGVLVGGASLELESIRKIITAFSRRNMMYKILLTLCPILMIGACDM